MPKYKACNETNPNMNEDKCRRKVGHLGNHKTWSNKTKVTKEWSNTGLTPEMLPIEERITESPELPEEQEPIA